MTTRAVALRRKLKAAERGVHGLWQILKAIVSRDHPLLAHLIPIRRCNLACTYCNEFDDFSKPVPIEQMLRRVDLLGDLGTSVITISGGEPLLHPQLDDIIHHMRKRRIVSGLITNGYLLTADRIQRLNRSGLEWLQISIDNVNPDEVSKKSLKVLDRKLQLLAEHADFHVNINSVVGSGISHPQDALTIGKRALGLGFSSTIGIIHDDSGQLQPLNDEERRVYHEMKNLEKRSFTRVNAFQDNIALGRPNQWRCRAGARYLFARTGWCITARSSAGIQPFRWRNTRLPICAASSQRRSLARRIARYRACTRYRSSTHGAHRNGRRRRRNRPADWCISSSFQLSAISHQ
jgi:MoaA/NifB/PqqE/SkfB family radical SAM enzyme